MDAIRISVVVVTWNARDVLQRTLAALLPELAADDELIVVDNASTDGSAELAAQLAPGAAIARMDANAGFAAGANHGGELATGDLLVLLNPDAAVAPGWRDALLEPLRSEQPFDAWQALVAMDGGRRVNTSGGVVHFTGLSWAGSTGAPVGEVDPDPHPVSFASGACLAISLRRWRELGGMAADTYFLYFEDVDLSLRLRLAGGTVGVAPAARVDHAYEFEKGALKWRMLERGRWATLIRTYPAPLLFLLAPALLATEAAVLAVAFAGGWGRQKLLAAKDTAGDLPRLLAERREIQRGRVITAGEFSALLTADLDSPYLGRAGRSKALAKALRAYWRLVRRLLRD